MIHRPRGIRLNLMGISRFIAFALFAAPHLGVVAPARAQREVNDTTLEIRFLDVGQGDAILIQYGNIGVLVDAGRGDDIVQILEEQGIDSLASTIVSHNHADHIGGMDAVLSDYPVGAYYGNGREPENDNAEAVADILAEEGINTPAPPWQPIRLGDARITVFPSPLDPDNSTENSSSLGVLIERGGFKALLTGDSEVEELNAWLKAGHIPDVDVLKAAHHGPRNGVTPGWLDRTRPEVVVISVGAGNSYGHPDPWAMRYYRSHEREVYRTDEDGTVVVTVDREGRYKVATLGPVER